MNLRAVEKVQEHLRRLILAQKTIMPSEKIVLQPPGAGEQTVTGLTFCIQRLNSDLFFMQPLFLCVLLFFCSIVACLPQGNLPGTSRNSYLHVGISVPEMNRMERGEPFGDSSAMNSGVFQHIPRFKQSNNLPQFDDSGPTIYSSMKDSRQPSSWWARKMKNMVDNYAALLYTGPRPSKHAIMLNGQTSDSRSNRRLQTIRIEK